MLCFDKIASEVRTVSHNVKITAMSEAYLSRLQALLQTAKEISEKALVPLPSDQLAYEKGTIAQVAFQLQGRRSDLVKTIVDQNAQDSEWTAEWTTGKAGSFVDYGIESLPIGAEGLQWISKKLASAPVVIRVFEADVAALSIALAERLLKVRARLISIRSRCEICVRIISGLEGLGRRIPPTKIEKMKLQLEKAEANARKQEEKLRLAEEKANLAEKIRREREKKREEKELAKNAKESSAMKKQRVKKAQSAFMQRFLKRNTPQKSVSEPDPKVISLLSPDRGTIDLAKVDSGECSEVYRLRPYLDNSVMSVSFWLRMQMRFDKNFVNLDFLKITDVPTVNISTLKAHLDDRCQERRKAEADLSYTLKMYRNSRTLNRDDKTPRFSVQRSDLRGRCLTRPKQLLQFDENHRPAFVGTISRRSRTISGRRPFAKDSQLHYDVDSEDEWEEEAEDGESLSDVEVEKEQANEDAELCLLYGSDDESDDDDFLDDEGAEVDADDDEDDDSSAEMRADSVPMIGVSQATSPRSSESKLVPDLSGDVVNAKLIVIDVDELPTKKRPAADANDVLAGSKKKRRRKLSSPNHVRVEIIGIDYGDTEKSSPLDAFPISTYVDAPIFTPFDVSNTDTVLPHINRKTHPS